MSDFIFLHIGYFFFGMIIGIVLASLKNKQSRHYVVRPKKPNKPPKVPAYPQVGKNWIFFNPTGSYDDDPFVVQDKSIKRYKIGKGK